VTPPEYDNTDHGLDEADLTAVDTRAIAKGTIDEAVSRYMARVHGEWATFRDIGGPTAVSW
jgi:hypothetical protein